MSYFLHFLNGLLCLLGIYTYNSLYHYCHHIIKTCDVHFILYSFWTYLHHAPWDLEVRFGVEIYQICPYTFISSFLHLPTLPTPIVHLAVWVPSFHFNHTFPLLSYSFIQISYKFLIDIATYHTVVYYEFHKVKFIEFSCWTHFDLLSTHDLVM